MAGNRASLGVLWRRVDDAAARFCGRARLSCQSESIITYFGAGITVLWCPVSQSELKGGSGHTHEHQRPMGMRVELPTLFLKVGWRCRAALALRHGRLLRCDRHSHFFFLCAVLALYHLRAVSTSDALL